MVRVATIFSGIGAPEHALERMGINYEFVFGCEIDTYARKTWLENHSVSEDLLFKDARELNCLPYRGKVDLLVGGSPCQSFSTAGQRGGFEDTRGTLFYEFIRLVDEVRPRWFIFENVRGVLSHDKGNTWEVMQACFDKLGYKWDWKLLNSKDYGVPQSRDRIFVVGSRNFEDYSFPEHVFLDKRLKDVLESNVDEKHFVNRPFKRVVRKGRGTGCEIVAEEQSRDYIDYRKIYSGDGNAPTLTSARGVGGSPKILVAAEMEHTAYMQEQRVIGTEGICPTLTASEYKHRTKVLLAERVRKLTPRECARLMGFSDSFTFNVSDTQRYKQCGNSMVVDVLMALFSKMEGVAK